MILRKPATALRGAAMAGLLPVVLAALAALAACGRKMSEADLQRKIDSVQRIENAERLASQGIHFKENNPLEAFYDSLAIQPLPLTSDESYIAMAPNFTPVAQELAALMGFETGKSTSLIALPESMETRLVLELVSGEGENRTLWLYSLGTDFVPVDKIMLYSTEWEQNALEGEQEINFSITSNYEIRVARYSKGRKVIRQVCYALSADRTFTKSVEEVKTSSPYKNF